MKRELAKAMGYHELPIRCCGICKHASYSKTMCKRAPYADPTRRQIGNAAVCPTGICQHFEVRSADQDKAFEDVEWMP